MQNLIKQFLTVIPFLFHWIIFNGQNYNLNTSYTINDGLPSNHVYDLCEDKNGFLWISTNNGVSRFDGKVFLNYSTKDGLPSNDVLQIVKEKNGTIWVNCYKQPPSYFDEKLNCFVSFDSNAQIQKISGSFLEILIPEDDGIIFQNELGIIEFKSQKVHNIYSSINKRIFINENKKYFIKNTNTSQIYTSVISGLIEKKERVLGKINFGFQSDFLSNQTVPNRVYNFTKYKIKIFKNFSFDSFTYKHDSILVSEPIKWFKINEDNLNIIAQSGTVYIYDKQTLKLKNYVNNNLASNTALIDKNNNLWISTVENGLLYYHVSPIKKLNVNKISNNFLSINVTNDRLLAGNFNGDILDVNKNSISIHSILDENKSLWIRNIFNFDSKIASISDAGYAINFRKNIRMFYQKKNNYSLKIASKLNDSILLIGTNTGLLKLNVQTNNYSILKSPSQRILAIEKIDNNHFYFVANLGLYKYNIDNQDFEKTFFNENLINDKIDNIALDRNKNLWISSFKGNIYLLKNNKIALKIPNSMGLPDNITSLLSVNQKLWIGSKSGIYILNHENLPKYSLDKLSKFDGLTSDIINSLYYQNDTIYAATFDGISKIPESINFPKYVILPSIISIKVNNKILPLQNSYHLKKDQKNIIILLAGSELSGHFKKFQYTLNDDNNWVDLESNTLNFSLKSGANKLVVRAVDVNNNISTKKIQLFFNVAIPFYNRILFWGLIAFAISGLLFWLFNRRKFVKQKQYFQHQLDLELQRSKITADLHDEIGSTLSSLQINSAIASQLLNKNPKEAQKVIEKIENQSHNLANKIGDIIWSMKPGKDQFMTLSSRIKNFANDLLGSTEINYNISIDNELDIYLTEMSTRKNILLIVKEAINNVAKYSKASQLDIQIKKINHSIEIQIIDNGVGFDTSLIKGNGLGNMKKRANELNGIFTIKSIKNNGTTIFVVIPCH